MALEDIENGSLRRFVYLAFAGVLVWHFVVMLMDGIFLEVWRFDAIRYF
jgi:uncharacterized membrane protein